MREWKWPAVLAFGVTLAAVVTMYALTEDATMRTHLVGYFDKLIAFVVGSAAGGTVGVTLGFARGKGIL